MNRVHIKTFASEHGQSRAAALLGITQGHSARLCVLVVTSTSPRMLMGLSLPRRCAPFRPRRCASFLDMDWFVAGVTAASRCVSQRLAQENQGLWEPRTGLTCSSP